MDDDLTVEDLKIETQENQHPLMKFVAVFNIIIGIIFVLVSFVIAFTPGIHKKSVEDYRTHQIQLQQQNNEAEKQDVSKLYPSNMPEGIKKLLENKKAYNFNITRGWLMFIGSVLLLISGFGIMSMKSWSKILGYATAAYLIIFLILTNIYYLAVLSSYYDESALSVLGNMVIFLIYPVILLICLYMYADKT